MILLEKLYKMRFEPQGVYHIFNQGNNRERIFFRPCNYDFFMEKIRRHIVPFADIVAFCLMPNHFHLLIRVKQGGCDQSAGYQAFKKNELHAELRQIAYASPNGVPDKLALKIPAKTRQQRLCHEIGIMLRSYTRAINIQEKRSGSLFRKRTKAKTGYPNNIQFSRPSSGIEYLPFHGYWSRCLNYILINPVTAGLVDRAIDWNYSSALNFHLGVSDEFTRLDVAAELEIYP